MRKGDKMHGLIHKSEANTDRKGIVKGKKREGREGEGKKGGKMG